mgnify:CR=1 FL=1
MYPDHAALLQERLEESLKQVEDRAVAGFPKAERQWRNHVARQRKRQAQLKELPSSSPPVPPNTDGTSMSIAGGPRDVRPSGTGGDAKEPEKHYRLTDEMKAIIGKLVLITEETCKLENEKNEYEGSALRVREEGLKKVLCQEIANRFPEGWMSAGQMSRNSEYLSIVMGYIGCSHESHSQRDKV